VFPDLLSKLNQAVCTFPSIDSIMNWLKKEFISQVLGIFQSELLLEQVGGPNPDDAVTRRTAF
jgi:hypothetical protein